MYILPALLTTTALLTSPPAVAAHASACPSGDQVRPLSETTLCLMNRARARHGVPGLRPDRQLRRIALRHSRDMVAHQYFSHDSRSGASFAARIESGGWMKGRAHWTVGENLAWHRAPALPRWVVRAWLRSPTHRRVLLDRRLRVVGIGIARGTPLDGAVAGATYTADFGS